MVEGQEDIGPALSDWFARPVRIEASLPVGGGSIHRTSILELDNGARVFLKRNSGRYHGLFRAEVAGLDALRCDQGPAVARPVALYESAATQYLILEYIESAATAPDFWQRFGRSMARLHQLMRSERFGFGMDNHIGRTHQVNTPTDRWIPFFGECRLRYQITLAESSGRADAAMVRGIHRIIERLDDYLDEPGSASLLHGDLWGGNYTIGPDGQAVLIDPAVYYGHPEADLAMTELFGGFSPAFLESYAEVSPLRAGYRDRVDIYNLYHLLNHLNLFGGGYASPVRATVSRYS